MDSKRILIVDDEEVRVPVIKDYMTSFVAGDIDYHVEHVTTMPATFVGYDIVFLDHDLGWQDVYHEIRKMKSKQLGNAQFVVHSMNPIGARNIANFLKDHKLEALIVPFSKMLEFARNWSDL